VFVDAAAGPACDLAMNINIIRQLGGICALAFCVGCDQAAQAPAISHGQARPAGFAIAVSPPNALEPEATPLRPAPSFSRDVAPILEHYCLGCHDRTAAEGGVVLDAFGDGLPGAKSKPLLLEIAAVLRSASMPPEDEPRPGREERETLEAWLDSELGAGARGTELARVNVRRLNRNEYNNTIRDLIGLDLRPADDFPADDIGYGFDNIADVLATPPVLVEMELAAAESVIDRAFRSPEIRARIINAPANAFPLAYRKYTPPVRSSRDLKPLRGVATAVDPELARQQHIYDILRAFADRAFRRPATHDELTRLLTVVLSAEKDGEAADAALKVALGAILASPQFLFRLEQVREAGPAPAGDFDLASRLSYFLWNSLPNDQLLQLAGSGTLRRADVLREQARRMLADPRAQNFAADFAEQWLQTRRLGELAPDSKLFPGFDESLRSAMIGETRLFCRSIQDEDRSILDFLEADDTFVNERLGRHYGLAGIRGDDFRRVSLAGTPRRGILTQASILAVTSNPTRTSPVKRGKWILENILGVSPAPPPSGVEALKEDAAAATARTLRERLERHRSDPKCASCHGQMDPLGFALENFDAIGSWRGQESGQAIDDSGRLPGGREFRGASGLRSVLLTRRDAFARCLAEKMFTYALGRGLDRSDRRDVDRIVERTEAEGYRFSALVLAIIESRPFREPANAGGS
jgi:hypothetical protein